jgi:hypothetical protein
MRQTSHLYSVSSHTRRGMSAVTSATAAVIRIRSSATFAGRGGTYTRSLTTPHRKKFSGVRSGEKGGHGTGAARPVHPPAKRLSRHLRRLYGNEGVRRLAESASFVVIFAKLWKEELFEHVQVVKRLLKHPVLFVGLITKTSFILTLGWSNTEA